MPSTYFAKMPSPLRSPTQPAFEVVRRGNCNHSRLRQSSPASAVRQEVEIQQAGPAVFPGVWQQAQLQMRPTTTYSSSDDEDSVVDTAHAAAEEDGPNSHADENLENGNEGADDGNDNDGGDAKREALTSINELNSSRVTVIEPKGTLALIVGSNHDLRRLIVSHNVKNLSPQWKAVVAESTREGFRGKKRVRLPDDDADMMLVLMWIVHTNFAAVPKTLDFNQLLEMARICDRYHMNEKMNPYIVGWITPHQPQMLNPGREQWLYIAYQFGMEEDFLKLSKHLAINCRINADKQLLIPGTDHVLTGCFPEECLSAIKHTRVKTLVSFLDAMYSLITKMVEGNCCRAQDATQSLPDTDERTMCTLYNHGFMIRYLRMLGYWPPIVNVGSIEDSVSEVANKLFAIPSIHMPSMRHDSVTAKVTTSQSTTTCSHHHACDAGTMLAGKIQEVIDRMEHPVEARTLEAIRSNARLLGRFRVETRKPKRLLVIRERDRKVKTEGIWNVKNVEL